MTIVPGDYAIMTGGWRPVVVAVISVTEKTVTCKEDGYRERRFSKSNVVAYGSDKGCLEKAVERMVSATAEGNRRRAAADKWTRDEHDKIAKEAMA